MRVLSSANDLMILHFILRLETKAQRHLAKHPSALLFGTNAVGREICHILQHRFCSTLVCLHAASGEKQNIETCTPSIHPLSSFAATQRGSAGGFWRSLAPVRTSNHKKMLLDTRRWPATKPGAKQCAADKDFPNMWLCTMFDFQIPKFAMKQCTSLQEKTWAANRAPPTKLSKREPRVASMPLLPKAPMSARGTTFKTVTECYRWHGAISLEKVTCGYLKGNYIHFNTFHGSSFHLKSLTVVALVSATANMSHCDWAPWVICSRRVVALSGREAGTWSSNFPRPCDHPGTRKTCNSKVQNTYQHCIWPPESKYLNDYVHKRCTFRTNIKIRYEIYAVILSWFLLMLYILFRFFKNAELFRLRKNRRRLEGPLDWNETKIVQRGRQTLLRLHRETSYGPPVCIHVCITSRYIYIYTIHISYIHIYTYITYSH